MTLFKVVVLLGSQSNRSNLVQEEISSRPWCVTAFNSLTVFQPWARVDIPHLAASFQPPCQARGEIDFFAPCLRGRSGLHACWGFLLPSSPS